MRKKLSALSADFYLRAAVFAASFSLVIFSFAAPVRQSITGFPSGESIYRALSLICHQFPARSFWIFSFPCGLCSRCLLGYAGVALAALLIWRPRRYVKRLLLGAALLAPGTADGAAQILTHYESTNFVRALTGLTGGMGLFIIFYPLGFSKAFRLKRRNDMRFLSPPSPRIWLGIITFALAAFVFSPPDLLAREVVLHEGVLIPVQTTSRISSRDAQAGTEIILEVERDIKVGDDVVIKAGAPVVALVADLKKAGMAGISGMASIKIEYATAVDGTLIPLRGSFNTRGDSEIGGTVAVGLILCPLAFLNKGKEGVIPAGAVIRALTVSDKTVKVSDR